MLFTQGPPNLQGWNRRGNVMNRMSLTNKAAAMTRRIGPSSGVELEYFCRNCKGHYSRSVPVASFWQTKCRCGSQNLLVYAISGEVTAPLRAN
jgi:hypothetical protein